MSAAGLHDLVSQLALPGVSWGMAVAGEDGPLCPDEETAIARAVPKRRAEFVLGRLAARRALRGLGIADCAIPVGPDRAPVWPKGIVGSISHVAGLAVAVAARDSDLRALGVDLELAQPLEVALIPEICRPEEIGPQMTGAFLPCVFCAKEAVFKAQFPLTGVMFGFHGLALDWGANVARFARIGETGPIPNSERSRDLPFVQVAGAGLILTVCALSA